MKFKTAGATAFMAGWREICAAYGTAIPHYRIAFERIAVEMIPSLLLVEQTRGDEYVARFMGTARVDRWGEELTGKDTIQFMAGPVASAARRNLVTVMDHPCGIRLIAHNTSPAGREMDTEYIVVPVGNDPGRPRRLLAFGAEVSAVRHTGGDSGVKSVSEREWIDLGAGVPADRPAK